MKKMRVDEISAGESFKEFLTLEDKNIILSPGLEISKEEINFLKNWKINFLQLMDKKNVGLVFEPDLGEKFNLEKDKYFDLIDKSISNLKKFYQEIEHRGKANIVLIRQMALECISIVEKSREFVCLCMLIHLTSDSNIESDSFKTAIYSLMIGKELKLEKSKLIVLFESAILCNIGLLKMRPLINKHSSLTAHERQIIQTHPNIAYNTIQSWANLSKSHSLIALTHQENVDGSGYPRKMTGDQIPLYAKIITVAKRYVALSVKKPYRKKKPLHECIRTLISEHQGKVDHNTLNCLLASLGLYPIGCVVMLNNHQIGVVFSANAKMPMSPKVLIVTDEQKTPLNVKKQVNLGVEKDLFIREVIFDDPTVSFIYKLL